MPFVRDKTKPKTEYKGRETWAAYSDCPCRPCYNAHDCGRYDYAGKWVTDMYCATNYNNGCPRPLPDPEHMYYKTVKRCKRCGHKEVN